MATKWGENVDGGILLVNKPCGVSSFHLVAQLRRLTGIKKIGHAGTLDPFASGLMILAIGRATRLLEYLEASSKQYTVGIDFSKMTTTGDLEGETVYQTTQETLEHVCYSPNWASQVKQIAKKMEGELWQVPPMFSAVKVNGRPLYQYARRGETVERKGRYVQIYECDLVSADFAQAICTVKCSKGTYIRSLAENIGANLGLYAHASSLVRTAIGAYDVANAIELEGLFLRFNELERNSTLFYEELKQMEAFIEISQIQLELPQINLNFSTWRRLQNGQTVPLETMKAQGYSDSYQEIYNSTEPQTRAAYYTDGTLLGIVELLPSEASLDDKSVQIKALKVIKQFDI